MKKTFTYIALGLILSGGTVVAQDSTSVATEASATGSSSLSLKSKRGYEILPQAGDWAIGISASGTLNYVGNLFNGNTGNFANGIFEYTNAPSLLNYTDGMNFFGKKFITSNSAYRVRVNILANSNSEQYAVIKDEVTPDINYPAYVEDVYKYSQTGVTLGLGKELRRGSHRIQGVYGAEALLGFYKSSENYTYGNDMNLNFPSPTDAFGGTNNGERMTNFKSGTMIFAGVRGFLGAEYFFAPKMSIGGEFGYTLGYANQGTSTNTYERYDALTNSVVEVIRKQYFGAEKFVGLSPENLNAAVNLLLYF